MFSLYIVSHVRLSYLIKVLLLAATAAHLVCDLHPHDHVTPALKQLHWLPIKSRIVYKLSSDARHPHWPGSSVLGRLCLSNRIVIRVFGSVCAHLTLPNTLNIQRGLNSANELSAMLARRLGMLFLLVYTTLQTSVNLENHLRPLCSNEQS